MRCTPMVRNGHHCWQGFWHHCHGESDAENEHIDKRLAAPQAEANDHQ
jgi:hypothetical protein